MIEIERNPIVDDTGQEVGAEYWRGDELLGQELRGPGQEFLSLVPGGHYGVDAQGVPYWGGESFSGVSNATEAAERYRGLAAWMISRWERVVEPGPALAIARKTKSEPAVADSAERERGQDKPWVVRGVPEETRRKVKVFAAMHGLSMAQAVERLVDTAVEYDRSFRNTLKQIED